MNIIGLCGFAGCGKDTAAAHMPGWNRLAFADPLKRDLEGLLTLIGCDLGNKTHKYLARPLLVAWGAVARRFNPDFWIERMMGQMAMGPVGPRVITDVRYPNEAAWIIGKGGRVVRIYRPGCYAANEEEEKSIADIDMNFRLPGVVNDSTPAELGRRVLEVVG